MWLKNLSGMHKILKTDLLSHKVTGNLESGENFLYEIIVAVVLDPDTIPKVQTELLCYRNFVFPLTFHYTVLLPYILLIYL